MWEPFFYADHAERYAHLSEDERKGFPDEIHFPSGRRIKRDKKLSEMTAEDWKRYGSPTIFFAAKDISTGRAEKWLYP